MFGSLRRFAVISGLAAVFLLPAPYARAEDDTAMWAPSPAEDVEYTEPIEAASPDEPIEVIFDPVEEPSPMEPGSCDDTAMIEEYNRMQTILCDLEAERAERTAKKKELEERLQTGFAVRMLEQYGPVVQTLDINSIAYERADDALQLVGRHLDDASTRIDQIVLGIYEPLDDTQNILLMLDFMIDACEIKTAVELLGVLDQRVNEIKPAYRQAMQDHIAGAIAAFDKADAAANALALLFAISE